MEQNENSKRKYGAFQRGLCLFLAVLLIACTLLTGCADSIPSAEEQQENTVETLGLAPVFEYELPKERPSVLTDQIGYLKESRKIAVFQGKELPEEFEIMEKESGQCVYRGKIRFKEKDAESGLSAGQGNFTDFQEEGSYYIQCEKIGCSYYFTIGEDLYLEMAQNFRENLEAMQKGYIGQNKEWYLEGGWQTDQDGSRNTEQACIAVSYLLLAYEIYPDFFGELWSPANVAEEERKTAGQSAFLEMIRYETEWLLAMQDAQTGGIYSGLKSLRSTAAKGAAQENVEEQYLLEEISGAATACFAGTMAKYGYLYQEYDRDYAKTCLKAAAKAWKYLEKEPDQTGEGILKRFYASTELYRASNERRYHNYVLQNQEMILAQQEDFYKLMGMITYLSTRRKVDSNLCGMMMNSLMEEAEQIAQKAKEDLFLVSEEDTDKILWDMTIMAVVDYVITNQEYYTIIEEHVHYFLGRNREAELLTGDFDIKDTARILMILGVVMAGNGTAEE